MRVLKVLVGCECSAVVRDEFRKLGHDAWSCDFKPCERDPTFHLQCDVREVLDRPWDIGVFHPDCDYLTVSGNRWFKDDAKAQPGILVGAARREARDKAVCFVKELWECSIPSVCIENPIGRLSTLWRKPTQRVEPFYFGDPFRKATCLWLRGLPPLVPTNNLGDGAQACWRMAPSATRKTDRARTYPGLAAAMAQQFTPPRA